MSKSEKPTRAFKLSLIAGILILINTGLVGAATAWFPSLIPTLPGSTGNDSTLLYTLTVAVLIFGAIVLFGAIMLDKKPANKKAWGILIIVFSIPSYLTAGGFIIGSILGIIGGALALRHD